MLLLLLLLLLEFVIGINHKVACWLVLLPMVHLTLPAKNPADHNVSNCNNNNITVIISLFEEGVTVYTIAIPLATSFCTTEGPWFGLVQGVFFGGVHLYVHTTTQC